jgi:hypothetical protein
MIDKIEYQGKCFALILRNEFDTEGVHFFTSGDNPLQLGVHKYKQGVALKPHIHLNLPKKIESIQEVLHMEHGKLQVDFYDDQGALLGNTILHMGDTILLLSGGHGFEVLEDCKIVEIKQGPYSGQQDDKKFLNI